MTVVVAFDFMRTSTVSHNLWAGEVQFADDFPSDWLPQESECIYEEVDWDGCLLLICIMPPSCACPLRELSLTHIQSISE